MLIPLSHDQMEARRWPIITFALIAINVAVFLFTHGPMQQERRQIGETKAHILMLAAAHPDLQVPADVQSYIEKFQQDNPALWQELQRPQRDIADEWDVRTRLMEAEASLQAEMDSLASRYAELEASSLTEQYAFIPAKPKPLSYLTANFLHVGWLHLIGNLWFLWLAGFVLEDAWGRIVYSLAYLAAGAAAFQLHALVNAGSFTPTLGASGAVAALMGAFLVRFPKLKINMAWIMSFRIYRFKVAAYWLLPLWLLMEIIYGTVFGTLTGVAHWAHVGGFVVGVAIALGMRYSGLEHKLNQSIEEKVSLNSDPEISQANDLFARQQYDEAVSLLRSHMATHPDSVDAAILLQRVLWQKGDMPGYQEAAVECCRLHLKARVPEAAWHDYDDYLNAGGELAKIPPQLRLELCRAAETLEYHDRALEEYRKLAADYPKERQSLEAQLGAAKVCLKRLHRPDEALKWYQAAAASAVPHLDLEPMIDAGIRETKAALAAPVQPALSRA